MANRLSPLLANVRKALADASCLNLAMLFGSVGDSHAEKSDAYLLEGTPFNNSDIMLTRLVVSDNPLSISMERSLRSMLLPKSTLSDPQLDSQASIKFNDSSSRTSTNCLQRDRIDASITRQEGGLSRSRTSGHSTAKQTTRGLGQRHTVFIPNQMLPSLPQLKLCLVPGSRYSMCLMQPIRRASLDHVWAVDSELLYAPVVRDLLGYQLNSELSTSGLS
ncbi:hypothetical protein BDZ45DRAFT_735596 [Acephala macrosclerotiorum]|nr:hypothetical protein BDZ45DRAFT_735596 [Acephala macrosclerotiorum]